MSDHHGEELDGYRWVVPVLYVLMAFGMWITWFARADLLGGYWGRVYHINAPAGNPLLLRPGLFCAGPGLT